MRPEQTVHRTNNTLVPALTPSLHAPIVEFENTSSSAPCLRCAIEVHWLTFEHPPIDRSPGIAPTSQANLPPPKHPTSRAKSDRKPPRTSFHVALAVLVRLTSSRTDHLLLK